MVGKEDSMQKLKKEKLLQMYRLMEASRQFETKASELFMDGEIPGFLHSSHGQEACSVGVCSALKKEDYIATTHRGHSHVIAKGADLGRMMAELYGREPGYCRGKSGSMHIMDRELGVLGANGITGGGIPIATGAALSAQIRGSGQVAVTFFGDGSSNEGSFHESVNMASIWKLPIIFVCENNTYAESTPQAYHQNVLDVAMRAQGYGIPGVIADGNDVLDVYDKAGKAVSLAREGKGPTLLELKTFRVMGHYVGDPGVYRDKAVVEHWRKNKDPIRRFRETLLTKGIAGEAELDKICEEVKAAVEAAVKFARGARLPDVSTALEDVYETVIL